MLRILRNWESKTMKPHIYTLIFAAVLLGACSKTSNTITASIPTPVNGLNAQEVATAQSVSAAILVARKTDVKDPSVQAIDTQMQNLAAGLDQRLHLLTAVSGIRVEGGTPRQGGTDPQVQMGLDANSAQLHATIAKARSYLNTIGGASGKVAGLPADSMRAAIQASLDRISDQVTQMEKAPWSKAVADVRDLRARLTPATVHNSRFDTPTLSIRHLGHDHQ
jgi:hypothetical protein